MANAVSRRGKALAQVRLLVNRAGFDVTRDQFKHRFLHALRQHQVDEVIDVGANTGQFGHLLRRSGFAGRIHSVEPLAVAYAQLQDEAAADRLWTTQRAAVSDVAGSITMNVSANSVSSSVLPMLERSIDAAPQTRYVATEEVPATTVDDIVSEHELDPPHSLLKIDVQGYEMPVLDGAAKTLETFAAIRTEMSLVPLYDGQVLMAQMIDHLSERGFDLWFVEPGFVEPGTRRLLQLDGVFFRRTAC
jgi:FkbM family methyltransferase